MASTPPSCPSPDHPAIEAFVSPDQLGELVRIAREEDMGPQALDITSQVMGLADRTTTATFHTRSAGRLCGAAVLPAVIQVYDPTITVEPHARDGDLLGPGQPIATVRGRLTSILAMERVALNFLIHLSGVATLTWRYVQSAAGTRARICDTRKTLPGLRRLQKYAVVCGQGVNHRMGLHDAVLVKDNHLAHLPVGQWPAAIRHAVTQARQHTPKPAFFQVEVDTLEQLEQVLTCPVDRVLLDNMDILQMRQAVAMRDRLAPSIELEASGGVNLDMVRDIAQTGVDRIAIGALTHSAGSLDIGLDIAPG